MNKIASFIILFILSGLASTGQVTLKIVIQNLENNNGVVVMDFRDASDQRLKGITQKINNKQCTIILNDLPPGKYSFKYFHDENKNNKMDNYWIGAPKEGMGFSNNARVKFGPPDFEDTLFEVKKDTTIVCTAHYIKL